uniref:Uncharacterized protein n=1 Tax=mine drainage metagenome TaxID=410659 RepID=E6PIX6_9ZZZZ
MRRAGYEDANDALRLRHDPTMRRIHRYQLELIVDTFRNFMRTLAIPEAIEP